MVSDARSPENDYIRCGSGGGRGIGAGHICLCIRLAGHPLDSERPHGCPCGAPWGCPDCANADPYEGCAGCGAAPSLRGLHPCEGCGLELDGDDLHTRCEECAPAVVLPPGHGACAICGAPRLARDPEGEDLVCSRYPEHYAVLGTPPASGGGA